MKKLILVSALLACLVAPAFCDIVSRKETPPSVTLAWDAPPSTETLTYKLYWGTASGVYNSVTTTGTNLTTTISGLDRGVTYYFAATANDSQGQESVYSNEVSYHVNTLPPPPVMKQPVGH